MATGRASRLPGALWKRPCRVCAKDARPDASRRVLEDQRERGLGRFTSRLIEAFGGAADLPTDGGDGDGLITFAEVAGYVRRTVADDSLSDAKRQHPTAGPSELLPFVALPLTRP